MAPKKSIPKKASSDKAPKRAPKPKLAVRNLHNAQFSFRTNEMQDSKKRIELKPRGERGDLYKLKSGQEKDEEVQNGILYGILEVITHAEADAIQEKQATNRQAHPSQAILRNEYGDSVPFTGAEPSYDERSVTVAELVPGAGGTGEIVVGPGGIQRTLPRDDAGAVVKQERGVRRSAPNDQSQAAADAKARIKGLGGPDAGLPDGVKVVVDAPVKS